MKPGSGVASESVSALYEGERARLREKNLPVGRMDTACTLASSKICLFFSMFHYGTYLPVVRVVAVVLDGAVVVARTMGAADRN